jgi:hypothetical protein
MKQKVLTGVLVVAAAAGAVTVVGAQDSQQPYNNPVPVQTSINEIMVMAVDYAAHWIWDAQSEPPATEEDWFRIRVHATQLVALGSAIALGGTGVADDGWVRSPEWVRDTQALVAASLDALEAAESQNFDALNAAGDRLVETCTSCHNTFKPELPTEGVLHRDVHRESRQAQ